MSGVQLPNRIMKIAMIVIGVGLIAGGIVCFAFGSKMAENQMLAETFGKVLLPVMLYCTGPLIALCGVLKLLYAFSANRKLASWVILDIFQ